MDLGSKMEDNKTFNTLPISKYCVSLSVCDRLWCADPKNSRTVSRPIIPVHDTHSYTILSKTSIENFYDSAEHDSGSRSGIYYEKTYNPHLNRAVASTDIHRPSEMHHNNDSIRIIRPSMKHAASNTKSSRTKRQYTACTTSDRSNKVFSFFENGTPPNSKESLDIFIENNEEDVEKKGIQSPDKLIYCKPVVNVYEQVIRILDYVEKVKTLQEIVNQIALARKQENQYSDSLLKKRLELIEDNIHKRVSGVQSERCRLYLRNSLFIKKTVSYPRPPHSQQSMDCKEINTISNKSNKVSPLRSITEAYCQPIMTSTISFHENVIKCENYTEPQIKLVSNKSMYFPSASLKILEFQTDNKNKISTILPQNCTFSKIVNSASSISSISNNMNKYSSVSLEINFKRSQKSCHGYNYNETSNSELCEILETNVDVLTCRDFDNYDSLLVKTCSISIGPRGCSNDDESQQLKESGSVLNKMNSDRNSNYFNYLSPLVKTCSISVGPKRYNNDLESQHLKTSVSIIHKANSDRDSNIKCDCKLYQSTEMPLEEETTYHPTSASAWKYTKYDEDPNSKSNNDEVIAPRTNRSQMKNTVTPITDAYCDVSYDQTKTKLKYSKRLKGKKSFKAKPGFPNHCAKPSKKTLFKGVLYVNGAVVILKKNKPELISAIDQYIKLITKADKESSVKEICDSVISIEQKTKKDVTSGADEKKENQNSSFTFSDDKKCEKELQTGNNEENHTQTNPEEFEEKLKLVSENEKFTQTSPKTSEKDFEKRTEENYYSNTHLYFPRNINDKLFTALTKDNEEKCNYDSKSKFKSNIFAQEENMYTRESLSERDMTSKVEHETNTENVAVLKISNNENNESCYLTNKRCPQQESCVHSSFNMVTNTESNKEMSSTGNDEEKQKEPIMLKNETSYIITENSKENRRSYKKTDNEDFALKSEKSENVFTEYSTVDKKQTSKQEHQTHTEIGAQQKIRYKESDNSSYIKSKNKKHNNETKTSSADKYNSTETYPKKEKRSTKIIENWGKQYTLLNNTSYTIIKSPKEKRKLHIRNENKNCTEKCEITGSQICRREYCVDMKKSPKGEFEENADKVAQLRTRTKEGSEYPQYRKGVENKLDHLITAINTLATKIANRKEDTASKANSDRIDKDNKNRHARHGLADLNDELELQISEPRSKTANSANLTNKDMEQILQEEMGKSYRAKKDIEDILNGGSRSQALQINIEVPTREGTTEITPSFSTTKIILHDNFGMQTRISSNCVSSSTTSEPYNVCYTHIEARNKDVNARNTDRDTINKDNDEETRNTLCTIPQARYRCLENMTMKNLVTLSVMSLYRLTTQTISWIVGFVQNQYSYISPMQLAARGRGAPTQLVCNICKQVFSNSIDLANHTKNQHTSNKSMDCCVCRHMVNITLGSSRRTGLFICRHCSQVFTRAYCCELHKQTCARRLRRKPSVDESLTLLR